MKTQERHIKTIIRCPSTAITLVANMKCDNKSMLVGVWSNGDSHAPWGEHKLAQRH